MTHGFDNIASICMEFRRHSLGLWGIYSNRPRNKYRMFNQQDFVVFADRSVSQNGWNFHSATVLMKHHFVNGRNPSEVLKIPKALTSRKHAYIILTPLSPTFM